MIASLEVFVLAKNVLMPRSATLFACGVRKERFQNQRGKCWNVSKIKEANVPIKGALAP